MEIKRALRLFLTLMLVTVMALTFGPTQVTGNQTYENVSICSFPKQGSYYTLAGRTFLWQIIDGENVTTDRYGEIHKWSIQSVYGDVAFVNRTYMEACISPIAGNYTTTYDFDYEIATNRTILSANLKTMTFDTTGFREATMQSLDMDVGEHTWGWFPTDLHIDAHVPVSWTFDRIFPDDVLYAVVDEETIQVAGETQDCWLLYLPPTIGKNGTQGRTETWWVDKDTGVPLKFHSNGWAVDGSFGWKGESVLVNTNIDLGAESTQPPSPTYTLTVPTTPGFPETGKFYTWYALDTGWYMDGSTNVTYYADAIVTCWMFRVTDDEAFAYKILWYDYVCDWESADELEFVIIRHYSYRINKATREILDASGASYVVNMTSLTYAGPEDLTPWLAGDIGEKTHLWLPTKLYLGASVNYSWTFDRPWSLDNVTYTVVSEKIISIFSEPQACWVLYLPPTSSIDGTWKHADICYSDKEAGILLYGSGEGWAVDGSAAYSSPGHIIDTNVELGPFKTSVFFNINPNPAKPGSTFTLKGILVDETSKPLTDMTVQLYARPLAGSWIPITSLVTDKFGIFKWQALIPPTVDGIFIFAVYYPGSAMYQSTYNFAILVIQ